MAQEIDRILESLDGDFEDKRELAQSRINQAADALVRQRAREDALRSPDGADAQLRDKYLGLRQGA